jgi:hypothetical protein
MKLSFGQEQYISEPTNIPMFNEIGPMFSISGFADLSIEFSLSKIYDDLSTVCYLYPWFRETLTKVNESAGLFSITHALTISNDLCTDQLKHIENYLEFFSVPTMPREKRQGIASLAIATLATGIGAYIAGHSHSTSQSEATLLSNQEHLIQVMRDNEHRISLNANHLETIRRVLNEERLFTLKNVRKTHVFMSSWCLLFEPLLRSNKSPSAWTTSL